MKQHGYALLLSVFTLFLLGGFWLGGTSLFTPLSIREEVLELSRARENLMHYALSYIDHYGAQGAGLGHLPCPDTDMPSAQAESNWHLDGPNPPCGHNAVQFGWLPRHVSVTDGRYHFHTRSRQRLLYAVSTNYVNNPLGHPVNPLSLGDIRVGQYDDVVAILATPRLETDAHLIPTWFLNREFDNRVTAFTLLRSSEIRPQLLQRAGAWLSALLNTSLQNHCVESDTLGYCLTPTRHHDSCELTKPLSILRWLNLGLRAETCADYQRVLENAFALFESVPLNRHWFIRNHWPWFIDIQIDEICMTIPVTVCSFQPMVNKQHRLRIRLQTNDPSPDQRENDSQKNDPQKK